MVAALLVLFSVAVVAAFVGGVIVGRGRGC